MAFRTNEFQQMSFDDILRNLTEREMRILQGSWAEDFSKHIFPNLDEKPFSVLYSSNDASKPNTPVNIILGLLILKEQFGLTDEELMEAMLFNIQFQYALHTTSFTEQPINDNTLRRFRNRVWAYEQQTGIDLIKAAFASLTESISGIMGMDQSLKRIDSAMISSGCRRLSRLSIMSETLRLAAREFSKSGKCTPLSEKYGDDDGFKDIAYRIKSEDVPSKMEEMLRDAIALLEEYPAELRCSDTFAALQRMIGDQSKETKDGKVLKPGKEISPESMQTPHEPDATYRKKSGKGNVGFVVNVVEACDGDKNLITGYDLQKNTYSDTKFLDDVLDAMPEGGGEAGTIVVDGAYASTEQLEKAEAKGVEIVTASIIGGMDGEFEALFDIDDEGRIVKCPAGFSPIGSKAGEQGYQAHFDAEQCINCQYCDRCPGVFQKNAALIKFSDAALVKAEYSQKIGTEEYQALINKRNGIEGVNSVLRRKFGVDHMRDKGLVRKRHRMGIIMMAINVGRLMKWNREQEMECRHYPSFSSFNLFGLFSGNQCCFSVA